MGPEPKRPEPGPINCCIQGDIFGECVVVRNGRAGEGEEKLMEAGRGERIKARGGPVLRKM